MGKWRRRWCVLQPTVLIEYRDDKCWEQLCETKLKQGACGFRFSTAGAPGEATKLRKERPYGLVLDVDPSVGKGRPFLYLDAGGVGALEQWMVALGQASAAAGALPKRPPRTAVELQRPLPLHFEAPQVLRRGESGYANSLIYKVESRTATPGWGLYHAQLCTSPEVMEALTAGVCGQMLQRLEPGFEVNPIEWWPWRKREPARRFQAQLHGVSWTLAMQLGSLDDLLPSTGADIDLEVGRMGIALQYNQAKSVGTTTKRQAERWEAPSLEDLTKLVLQRAETLGLPVTSLECRPDGGFEVKLSEPLPELTDRAEAFQKIVAGNDNLSTQEQEVRQYLEQLQKSFPAEQEGVITLARSKHTQIWRKEQAEKCLRRGCLDDVPFAVLHPPCLPDWWVEWFNKVATPEVRAFTDADLEAASDMIMLPNPKIIYDYDIMDELQYLKDNADEEDEATKYYREYLEWMDTREDPWDVALEPFKGPEYCDKEAARIKLLKSCKWTVNMPLPLWQLDFFAEQPSWKTVDPASLHQVEECKMVFKPLPGGLFSRCTKIFPTARQQGKQPAVVTKGDYVAARAGAGAPGKLKLWGRLVVTMMTSPKNRLQVQTSMRKPLTTELVGPAWREFPLDVIKNDTLPTEESCSKRKKLLKKTRWTLGRLGCRRQKQGNVKKLILATLDAEKPPAWILERLIPEDYTRELALVHRQSRVEEFLAAKAQKEATRATKGQEYVIWPISGKWNASWCKQPKVTPIFSDDGLKTFKACTPGFTQEPIELPSSATISGSGPRTVCLWVKTRVAAGEQVLYASGTGEQGSSFELVLYSGNPKLARWSNKKVQGDRRVPQIADGEWHHVAVTHNGQDAYLWVDGDVWYTEKSKLNTPSTACRLGQKVGHKKTTFVGQMRGIGIFDSDIGNEVKSVYRGQVYFRMEDVARKKRFLQKPHLYVDSPYLEELTAFRKEWRHRNLSAHDTQNWKVLASRVAATRDPSSSHAAIWLEKDTIFKAKLEKWSRDFGSTLEILGIWRWDSFAEQWSLQGSGSMSGTLYTKLDYPRIMRCRT